MKHWRIKIIGAGLAGSECALVLSRFLSRHDFESDITLVEMRPGKSTDVHKSGNFGELVCSNSFKTFLTNKAAGMLKYELASLASPVFNIALKSKVDSGRALAVDRDIFSAKITEQVKNCSNIRIEYREATDINEEANGYDFVILATGPLTSDSFAQSIEKLTGDQNMSFYDAAAPIIMADSIDRSIIFGADRYEESDKSDYLNAPFEKDNYLEFIKQLTSAEKVIKRDFESKDLFQACQPVEEVARSGVDSLRYGALKPVGITNPRTGRWPYAVVQLRAENKDKTSYNLVGFQTNLTFGEQKRVFRMIPGLENAEFARYGVMHRNTFICAPKVLSSDLSIKIENNNTTYNIYVAGQLGGTEGYMEAVRSGHHVAISIISKILSVNTPQLSENTLFGALLSYATNSETENYQPMHVNFGIIPPLDKHVRNKKDRYNLYGVRARSEMNDYIENLVTSHILSDSDLELANYLVNSLEGMQ